MPIPATVQQRLLDEYSNLRAQYADFARSLAGLVENLLDHRQVQIHSVSYRVKDPSSLAEKLRRPDKSYSELSEITDLAGVRIITYFADDVDVVASLLRTEFSIDDAASVDKRQYSDPNQFGYRSLHYITSLGVNRSSLAEYQRFSSLRCEVQVRSILQHAWAEIEHDLGYKSASGVPAALRRKFARIAGLLELADDEFLSIRAALSAYEKELPEKIRSKSEVVPLDVPSFKALYSVPSTLTSLDDTVVKAGQGTLNASNVRRPGDLVDRLQSFGILTVQDLESVALRELRLIPEFVKYWLGGDPIGAVDAGIGTFYLLYLLAWRTRDKSRVLRYLDENSIGFPEGREDDAERILSFRPSAT